MPTLEYSIQYLIDSPVEFHLTIQPFHQLAIYNLLFYVIFT